MLALVASQLRSLPLLRGFVVLLPLPFRRRRPRPPPLALNYTRFRTLPIPIASPPEANPKRNLLLLLPWSEERENGAGEEEERARGRCGSRHCRCLQRQEVGGEGWWRRELGSAQLGARGEEGWWGRWGGRWRRRRRGRWPRSPRSWSPPASSSSAPSRASQRCGLCCHGRRLLLRFVLHSLFTCLKCGLVLIESGWIPRSLTFRCSGSGRPSGRPCSPRSRRSAKVRTAHPAPRRLILMLRVPTELAIPNWRLLWLVPVPHGPPMFPLLDFSTSMTFQCGCMPFLSSGLCCVYTDITTFPPGLAAVSSLSHLNCND